MAEPIDVGRSIYDRQKSYFCVLQEKLSWDNFTKVGTRPEVEGTPVDAIVSMSCQLRFFDTKNKCPLYREMGLWKLAWPGIQVVWETKACVAWKKKITNNTAEQNALLLKHERVHVEMYERFGRWVHQKVVNLTSNKASVADAAADLITKADKIRQEHWAVALQKNKKYDQVTRHGTVSKAQEEWNKLFLSAKDPNGVL